MKIDALVVDEGQDFGEIRLWAARALVRDGGSFVYCSDDRQDLYDRSVREAIGAEVVFSLVHNCRNTQRINEKGNQILDEHIPPMPGLPEGAEPLIECEPTHRGMAKAAWRRASAWVGEDTRVAILSPYTLENSSMASAQKGHNLSLVTKLEQWTDRTVLFSSIKSFKGLEADAVIVVDVTTPAGSAALDQGDLYVAVTRARARLSLICRTEQAAARLRGAPA